MVKKGADVVQGIANILMPILLIYYIRYAGGAYFDQLIANAKYMFHPERLTGNYVAEKVYFPDENIFPFELPESTFGTICFLFCPSLVICFKTFGVPRTIGIYAVFGGFYLVKFLLFSGVDLGGRFLKQRSTRPVLVTNILALVNFTIEICYNILCLRFSLTRPMMYFNYLGVAILMILNGQCFDRFVLFDFLVVFSTFFWCLSICLFGMAGCILAIASLNKRDGQGDGIVQTLLGLARVLEFFQSPGEALRGTFGQDGQRGDFQRLYD